MTLPSCGLCFFFVFSCLNVVHVGAASNFLIDASDAGHAVHPTVCRIGTSGGDAILSVCWHRTVPDTDVWCRIYQVALDGSGVSPTGDAFMANLDSLNKQDFVACGGGALVSPGVSGMIIAWTEEDLDIEFGTFDRNISVSGDVKASVDASGDQLRGAKVAVDPIGRTTFVVAWQRRIGSSMSSDLITRVYNLSNGIPSALSGELKINQVGREVWIQNILFTEDGLSHYDVIGTSDARFGFAWMDSSDFDIYFSWLDSGSLLTTNNVRVNDFTTAVQADPVLSVFLSEPTKWMIAWTSTILDGDGEGIISKRNLSSPEIVVNNFTSNHQRNPSVTTLIGSDTAVFVWESDLTGVNNFDARVQRTKPNSFRGGEFTLNENFTNAYKPKGAAVDDQRVFFTWYSRHPDFLSQFVVFGSILSCELGGDPCPAQNCESQCLSNGLCSPEMCSTTTTTSTSTSSTSTTSTSTSTTTSTSSSSTTTTSTSTMSTTSTTSSLRPTSSVTSTSSIPSTTTTTTTTTTTSSSTSTTSSTSSTTTSSSSSSSSIHPSSTTTTTTTSVPPSTIPSTSSSSVSSSVSTQAEESDLSLFYLLLILIVIIAVLCLMAIILMAILRKQQAKKAKDAKKSELMSLNG